MVAGHACGETYSAFAADTLQHASHLSFLRQVSSAIQRVDNRMMKRQVKGSCGEIVVKLW